MEPDPQHFHERVILKNRNEIQRKIDPIAVLDHMGDTLSDWDRQRITQRCRNEGHIAGASELMDVLLRAYPETFVRFVEAMMKAGSGDSGRVLALKLCRCVPNRFKTKISHIFPGIQGECLECSNDGALVPHGAEEQPSRSDQCSLGNSPVVLKGFSPDSFPAQQGNNVAGNLSLQFMSEKRGLKFQAQVHCGFMVPEIGQSWYQKSNDWEEAATQLPTSQEKDKGSHEQQAEERRGSDKGESETGLYVTDRSCKPRDQRFAEFRTTPSFFSMVMGSSLPTHLVNTTCRDVDVADEKLSNERLKAPDATIGMQQMQQGFQPSQRCTQRKHCSGPEKKQAQERLCVKSLDGALRTRQESGAVDRYCYSIDTQRHFTKRLHMDWLAAIQNAMDTVRNESVKGRDE